MRILSYNILDGGADRADLLIQVIQGQRPDVVGLVEADDPAVVERFAKQLQMDFIHAPGRKGASAFLSRLAIRHTINHAPMHPAITKSLLEAAIVNGGEELTFGVLHLHAHASEADEAVREREIAEALKIFEPYRAGRRPHLLMGDFNANAPTQRIDPAHCKKSTREEWAKNGGYIPRRVIQAILDAGYVDSFHALHPDLADTSGTFSTEFPCQRVDYIFTFGIDPRRLREAWIVYDPPAKEASDHYPVGLELA